MEMQMKPKLKEILGLGYKDTGKKYKILSGIHKGKEFPVYAMEGDVAGLVYNNEEDKIELVYKMPFPFNQNNKNGLNVKKEYV
jgi:hypothetical protein